MRNITAFDISEFSNFSPHGRCVNWLYRSAQCDIILTCWEPGQTSSYHDHLKSESVVYVMQGRVTVLSEEGEQCYEAGHLIVTPEGVKHQLRNDDQGRLITLHVYTPHLEGRVSEPLNDYTESVMTPPKTHRRGGSYE